MGKENRDKKVVAEDGGKVFRGPTLDFSRWSLLLEWSYVLKAPWEEVVSIVDSLLLPSEIKARILRLIGMRRGGKDREDPDVAS